MTVTLPLPTLHTRISVSGKLAALGRFFFLTYHVRSCDVNILVFGRVRHLLVRYMPPEVARSLPANETVDVYSFALVMWEMVSLELPFQFYSVKDFLDKCVHGNRNERSQGARSRLHLFLLCFLRSCPSLDRVGACVSVQEIQHIRDILPNRGRTLAGFP